MIESYHCSVFEGDIKILCYTFISICSTEVVKNTLKDSVFNIINMQVDAFPLFSPSGLSK